MRKVLIATPIYESVSPDFAGSIIKAIPYLIKKDIHVEWAYLVGCCYVHTARNKITAAFRNSDFDEILWWDSDIGAEPEGILRLIEHDREIVGAAAPFRAGRYTGFPTEIIREDGFVKGLPEEGLLEAKVIPTALMKVKREVFDTLIEKKMAKLCREYDRSTGQECETWYSFFDFEYADKEQLEFGEDVTFCRKCEKAGYQLWVEPRVTIRHHGMDHRTGNLDEYLRK